MTGIGGSVEAVSLDGNEFTVAGDADSTRDIGGFTNEVAPNGDGSGRLLKNRKPWIISGLTLAIDDFKDDSTTLQNLANRNDYFPITVTYASGVTYQGLGQLTADLNSSSANTTESVTLSGAGALTKQ